MGFQQQSGLEPTGPLVRLAARAAQSAAIVGSAGAYFSCGLLVLMVLLIFANILIRNLVGGFIDYTGEIVGYGVAAITYGGLAYALRGGVLIRVSLLARFARRHPSLDRFLHGAALALTAFVSAMACWYFWLSVVRHWQRGTVSATTAEVPMWLPESVMLAGLVLFLLQVLVQLLNLFVGSYALAGATLGDQGEPRGSGGH